MTMNGRERFEQLVVRWMLVVLPTLLIGIVTLRFLNFSYTNLSTSIANQSLWFAAGLLISYSLYFYRARWIISLILLWLAYMGAERIISRLPGEFDVFYTTARFQLYSTLFLFGWGFGLVLAKIRWSYILVFGILTVATLVIVSDTIDLSIEYLLLHLFPVIAYGLYMYFLSPILIDRVEVSWKQSRRLVLRLLGFMLIILLAFVITDRLLRGSVKAVEKELAARGGKGDKDGSGGDKNDNYDDRYGLMDRDDDGFRLKDTMKVNTRMSQSDRLMFCAKLDNYFPNGDPMPLYFVYHYLTRYDPVKESFTRDVNVPSMDEFDVDPAELPMYYSFMDTSIIRKAMAYKLRKIVQGQVYLSADSWKHAVLGPANVFSIQTIPVEKDFQKQFLSAYRIQSFASELNNAYFVYNVSASPALHDIQEERHDELRTVADYAEVDPLFLEYYTRFPEAKGIYDSISALAHSLVPIHAKPVDKVLAVRDFFLKRNENGKRIFRYTLKPGRMDDPNIPSSRMLYDFLFKTHAGYCTYYAGASLFMLRALGVPARFTTGFATVNRSDKNKGWYWFYASQAHAWTQVYFPEYGWLDFDMTIGNEDQQGAPKPDGTPPLPPPDPWLVLDAKAVTIDQTAKRLDASFESLLFLEKPFKLKTPITRTIDVSMCRVLYDKKDTTLSVIQPGDSLIVVSYKDEARQVPELRKNVPIETQIAAFPSPIIADEIHIRAREKDKKKDETGGSGLTEEKEKKVTFEEIAWMAAKGVGAILLLLLFAPLLYLIYRMLMAVISSGSNRADQVYRSALYRLHMAGLERETETPLQYAQRSVDPELEAGFEQFMVAYLRLKYSGQPLQAEDLRLVNDFASNLGPAIRKKTGFAMTFLNYFNLARALRYFQQPVTTEPEETKPV